MPTRFSDLPVGSPFVIPELWCDGTFFVKMAPDRYRFDWDTFGQFAMTMYYEHQEVRPLPFN